MMATFMFMMIPRAEVCAERIEEVLDTESSVVPPADAGHDPVAGTATWSCATSSFRYPGAEEPVLCGINLVARPRRDDRGHRQHRQRQDHPAQPGPAAVRRHRRRGAGRRRRRARPRPGAARRARSGCVPQKPYLFSGTVASNLRYGKPDATDEELWQALEVAQARTSSRQMPERPRRADRARAAPTSPAASGSGSRSPGRWCARPEIYLFDDSFSALDYATDAALRAALTRRDRRRDRGHRRPAGQHHPRRRPDRRARRGPGGRHRHAPAN